MRMAIVEVIGNLIRELALSSDLQNTSSSTAEGGATGAATTTTPTDASQVQKQLSSFNELLLSRTLDLSSYVRTKVLATLTKLCDLPTKFPQQRLAITRAAVGMLEDKAAGVRKGAVGLLVRLVVTHPWGLMHGGLLGLKEWEGRYKDIKGELEKVEAAGVAVGGLEGNAGNQTETDGETEDEDEDQEDEDEDEEMADASSSVDGTPRKAKK